LVRLGQTDGVIGLFDNCLFTSQCWDAGVGELNGGAMQADGPAGAGGLPWPWRAQAGVDYGNNKIVYMTPQLFGFDFGVQYAPNEGNSFANEGLAVGCNQAASTCINVSSGNDATRWINQVGAGLRFQQTFGPVDVKAYGFYETAGKENLTTAAYTTPAVARAGTVIGGVTSGLQTLRYDNLNFYKGGLAVTAANLTAAIDYIGGAVNGTLQMRPTGGASTNAFITGLTYANGPVVLGSEIGLIDSQGDGRLTGVSQRREFEMAFGGNYKLAPGVQLVAEYQYMTRHQGGYDFNAGSIGATRDAKAQGFTFSTVLTW
jgi:hypothetical protein